MLKNNPGPARHRHLDLTIILNQHPPVARRLAPVRVLRHQVEIDELVHVHVHVALQEAKEAMDREITANPGSLFEMTIAILVVFENNL